MTIVGKSQVSYLTYFTLVKELKDRRVWFHSCVRNSYLILDCLQSVFFFRTPQTYCIEYKGEGLRRQGYWKKSLLESFFFLFHAWLINLKCLAKNMCARYTEVVTRSVQYKNAKILDTRQLRQTQCLCSSHCLLEVIHLHNSTVWITKAGGNLTTELYFFVQAFRPH